MTEFSDILDIDQNFLTSKFRFLVKRAVFYLDQSDKHRTAPFAFHDIHLAYAATLYRDAAAIALLLGKTELASQNFIKSGKLRFRLGYNDGGYLLRLGGADSEKRREIFYKERASWAHDNEREQINRRQRVARAEKSPRYIISVIQGLGDVIDFEILKFYINLDLNKYSHPVPWLNNITPKQYIDIFHDVTYGDIQDGILTLTYMLKQRVQLIREAQRDRFHWKLVPRPAALIDMDILLLALTALERNQSLFEELQRSSEEFGSISSIPFYIAQQLRPPTPQNTPPSP